MEYSEYRFRVDTLNGRHAQEIVEKRARAMAEWFPMASAGAKITFNEYLDCCGLSEKEDIATEDQYREAAESALKMFQAVGFKK